MIFGVAVVFPVVITFGVGRRVWQGEQLQALCTGEQRSRPSGGNVASINKQHPGTHQYLIVRYTLMLYLQQFYDYFRYGALFIEN